MALLDDLKGLLSPEEFAKISGNQAIATRLTRGDELRSFYDGEEEPLAARTTEPPAARVTPPGTGGAFDIAAIERALDARLGTIKDTVKAQVEEAVKTRGDELYNNVRAGVRTDALQLVKIYTRHQQVTGRDWDDAEEVKFNDYLKANNEAVKTGGGKRYATLTDAYNDYIAPTVTERTIETEVDKRFKAKQAEESGKHLPGVTPGPAVNSNIRHFQTRTATGGQAETTGAGRAAAALDKIMSRRNESAA